MSNDVQQLVADAVELTGAPPPALLDPDAPVLAPASTDTSLYLVGLIGGKDVGKSSLVNAIVGQPITRQSSFGEGTGRVIAYVHEAGERELRSMLSREVPEKFTIVAHRIDRLRRQALLDLPDIDSHWTEHVQITRRMLRHMLFPLWIQSVEKYADLQPQKLLSQVAEGNDPANFVFVLNKADQLIRREGQAAAETLRADYAARIARTLKLAAPPRVYLISATQRDAFELAELRSALSQERSESSVERSTELAGLRRHRSLIDWLDEQNLSERSARATRSLREAEELVAARITVPVTDDTLTRIVNDPGHRLAMVEPVMSKRLSRWPIVNVINVSLSPLAALVRKNLSAPPLAAGEGTLLAGGRPVAKLVQTTFAQLRQTDPTVAQLYADRPLWEDYPADAAAIDLRNRIDSAIARQRAEAVRRIATSGFGAVVGAPVRWLLTIGALLWFPLIQPLLERVLATGFVPSWREIGAVIVPLLGASYLLQSAAFLLIWFAALWMILRWDTHRRVNRCLKHWAAGEIESELSLHGQVLRWTDDLLEPLRRNAERSNELTNRLNAAKATK